MITKQSYIQVRVLDRLLRHKLPKVACQNPELAYHLFDRLVEAKSAPAKVKKYVDKFLDEGKDESYAWALAWSIYCKHKNPDSDQCKQKDYLKKSFVEGETHLRVLKRFLQDPYEV